MTVPTLCVSVVIPAYNVARWIGPTLESVMGQTFPDWEAIVVNDGSTDTSALEEALGPFRDRITYHVQPNRGAAAARNAALAVARGEWVAFLDADDCWEPAYLQRQLEVLEERSLDMVWSNGIIVDEDGLPLGELMGRSPSRGPVTVEALLNGEVHVFTSATVVRRSLVRSVGGFTEPLRRAQDFDLWVRLLLAGARVGYHAEPLIRYRVRPGNLSGGQLEQADRALAVFQHLESHVALPEKALETLRRRRAFLECRRRVLLGRRALAAGRYSEAAVHFREAEALEPTLRLRMAVALTALSPRLLRWLDSARPGRPE